MADDGRIQGVIWEVVHDGVDVAAPSGNISYQNSQVAFSPYHAEISYQNAQVAFRVTSDTSSISYQNAQVAFAPDWATISYQNAQVAFSPNWAGIGYQNSQVAFAPEWATIAYQNSQVAFHLYQTGNISYQNSQVAFILSEVSSQISYQNSQVAFALAGAKIYEAITEVAWIYNSSVPYPPVEPIPAGKGGCGVLVNPDFSLNTYGIRTLTCERIRAPGVEQVPFRLGHKTNLGLRRVTDSATPIKNGDSGVYGIITEVAWVYEAP